MFSQSSFLLFSSNTTTVTAIHSFPTKPPSKLFSGMCFLSIADNYLYRYDTHSWNIYVTCYLYMIIVLSKLYDYYICFTSMCHSWYVREHLISAIFTFPRLLNFRWSDLYVFQSFQNTFNLILYWVLIFYKQRKWGGVLLLWNF